jgi:hypothetical protein
MANSPVIAAARKNIQAANAQVSEAKCLFCPRITAEGGISRNWNLDGVEGPNHDATAMLMYRQNLYNGGRDVAQRDERIKVLRAISPFTTQSTVRGQYKGYRGDVGVAPDGATKIPGITAAIQSFLISSWSPPCALA